MSHPSIAALCKGVRVPHSPFLNETRIRRIQEARYEGEEIAGALHVVRQGDRVLEMGAGLGVVSAVTALNARPARILSFEANPALIPHIRALHAEQNALLQAARIGVACEGSTIYVTCQPCSACAKMVINAGIQRVIYEGDYPDPFSLELFRDAHMEVFLYTESGLSVVELPA